jgi:hypothetical protein
MAISATFRVVRVSETSKNMDALVGKETMQVAVPAVEVEMLEVTRNAGLTLSFVGAEAAEALEHFVVDEKVVWKF